MVLSNNPELVDTIFVENTEGLPSDHKSISFNLFRLAKVINSPSRYVYDFKNADFRSLRAYLSLDTNDIPEGTMDDALKSWKKEFLEAVNVFVPRRKVRHSQRARGLIVICLCHQKEKDLLEEQSAPVKRSCSL